MTTEQGHMVEEAIEQGATYAGTVHHWAYPDAYCYAEYPAGTNQQWAIEDFVGMAQAYRQAMSQLAPQQPQNGAPPPQQAQPRVSPQRQQQRAQGAQEGPRVFCPDHGVAVQLSQQKYQKYDELPDGTQVPARYFHPLAPEDQYLDEDGRTVKNHSLWRRDVVDSSGTPIG